MTPRHRQDTKAKKDPIGNIETSPTGSHVHAISWGTPATAPVLTPNRLMASPALKNAGMVTTRAGSRGGLLHRRGNLVDMVAVDA